MDFNYFNMYITRFSHGINNILQSQTLHIIINFTPSFLYTSMYSVLQILCAKHFYFIKIHLLLKYIYNNKYVDFGESSLQLSGLE